MQSVYSILIEMENLDSKKKIMLETEREYVLSVASRRLVEFVLWEIKQTVYLTLTLWRRISIGYLNTFHAKKGSGVSCGYDPGHNP